MQAVPPHHPHPAQRELRQRSAQILPGAHHISYQGSEQTLRVTTDASISSILDEKAFFLEESVTLILGPDQAVESSPQDVGRGIL